MGTALQRDTKAAMRLSYKHSIHNAMCMICYDLFTHAFMICVQLLVHTLNHSIIPLSTQHLSLPRHVQRPIWAYYIIMLCNTKASAP